jgi:hypothetical protein
MTLPVTIAGLLSTAINPVGPFKVTGAFNPISHTSMSFTGGIEPPGQIYGFGLTTSQQNISQPFDAPAGGTSISKVRIYLSKIGSPVDNVQISIRLGSQLGSVMASSNLRAGTSITATVTAYDFYLYGGVTLTAGQRYYITINRSGGVDGANYYRIGYNGGVYSAGNASVYNGSTWTDMGAPICWRMYTNDKEAYYAFGRDVSVISTLQPVKALDDPSVDGSWTTAGALTGYTSITHLSGYQVGTAMHLIVGITSAGAATYNYLLYDTTTDSIRYSETIAAALATTGQTGALQVASSIMVRSNGEAVALFNGTQTKTSGTFYARMYYSRRTGLATWSAPVQVDANTAFDFVGPGIALGAGDSVHFLWRSVTGSLYQRTLSAANALQTASTAGTGVSANFGTVLSYVEGASTLVQLIFEQGSTTTFTSANTPTFTGRASFPGRDCRMFNDGGDSNHLYLVYAKSADSDLYGYHSTDDWASYIGEYGVLAGVTQVAGFAARNNGVTYQRGNAIIAPYLFNDNATIKYGEYVVRTVAQADAWNVNDKSANITLSNNDKKAVLSTAATAAVRSTQVNANTTPYYAEFVLDALPCQVGMKASGASLTDPLSAFAINSSGNIYNSSQTAGNIGARSAGDVIGLAWNGTKAWVRANDGLWNDDPAADPATGVNGLTCSYYGTLWFQANTINSGATIRTEVADFTKVAPAGFKSWMGEVIPTADAWSAADKTAALTLSNGDKTAYGTAGSQAQVRSTKTVAASGADKLYLEIKIDVWSNYSAVVGIHDTVTILGSALLFSTSTKSFGVDYYARVILNGVVGTDMGTLFVDDVVSLAFDRVNKRGWVRIGTRDWNGVVGADPATNVGGIDLSSFTGEVAIGALVAYSATNDNQITLRTEKAEFTQPTPAGYLSWMGETLLVPDQGTLVAGSSSVSGSGVSGVTGTAALVAQSQTGQRGAGVSSSLGTAALIKQDNTLSGLGSVVTITLGTGALAAGVADLDAVGLVKDPPITGTGALVTVAALAGAGATSSAGTGTIAALAVTGQRGTGVSSSISTQAALIGTISTLAGAGISQSVNTVSALAAVGSTGQRGAGSSASSGTAALASSSSATVAPGVSSSAGTGALVSTVADLDALGSVVSGVSGSGALTSFSVLAGAGLSRSISTSAALTNPPATVTAVAVGQSAGVATLSAAASALASVGAVSSLGIATLASQSSATVGAGIARHVATGTLASQPVAIVAPGVGRWVATGTLPAGTSAATGAGKSASGAAAVALQATVATVSGFEGVVLISGTGSVPAQSSGLSGVAIARSLGTGALIGPTAALAGTGLSGSVVTGTLVSQVGVVTAPGKSSSSGSGALVSGISSLAGSGAVVAGVTGTGILSATVGDIDGLGGSLWVASGALSPQASVVAASGLSRWIATGALSASPSTATGAGSSLSIVTAAALQAARSTVLGSEGIAIISGTGSVPAQSAKAAGVVIGGSVGAAALTESAHFLDGEGTSQSRGQGVLADQNGSLSGSGVSIVDGSAALVSTASDLTGAGVILAKVEGSGTLTSLPATLAGFANLTTAGAGALSVQTSVVHGSGLSRSTGWGVPRPVRAVIEAEGLGQSLGTGVMVSRRALMLAFGKVEAVATGSLQARDAKVAGFQVGVVTGIGVIVSGAGVIVGQGYVGVPERPSTPLPPSYPGTRPWGGVGYTSTFSGVTRTWTNPGTRPWRRVA